MTALIWYEVIDFEEDTATKFQEEARKRGHIRKGALFPSKFPAERRKFIVAPRNLSAIVSDEKFSAPTCPPDSCKNEYATITHHFVVIIM